jgi:integrase
VKGGEAVPSLRKRKQSANRTTWDIRYQQDGKTRVYTIGETDRRTAERIYREFCSQLAEGRYDGTRITVDPQPVSDPGLRLSDLAAATRSYAEANKSVKTLEREQMVFKRVIRTLGDLPLSELTPLKLEEYKAARLRDASPATINIEIRVLNTALNQAVAMEVLKREKIMAFKQIRMPESEPLEWLDESQIEILLATDDMGFRQFMQFLLHTGCRRNEALGVTWDDIDLRKRQIVIRGQIGKMGKRRTIPINDNLFAVLSDWHGSHAGRVFPHYESNQVSMKFRRWRRQVGLPEGISIHSLRATFACHLIKNGVDIYTVSRLLGHSSVKVTEKHYLALDPRHVQSAVNQLNYGPSRLPDSKLPSDVKDDKEGA